MSEHIEADLLDEYALGTLDAAAAARVAAHLKVCAACRAQLAELRAVLDVLPHALDERAANAALLGRIIAQAERREPAPRDASPETPPTWFASPLVRALAAGLILALASDAWLAFRALGNPPQTVAVATATPVASPPTPAAATPTAAAASAAPAPTPAHDTPPAGTSESPALQREIARLSDALATEKAAAAEREAGSRAEVERLQRMLADAHGAVRVVYVTPQPAPAASAQVAQATQTPVIAESTPQPAPSAAPALVAALRTGRVFAVDGTVGSEPWHLTIVQPAGKSNALIFSGTPHAPDGQTYRTWVVRDGKTYDAGQLPPAQPTTLEMPMPLQSGDVVAFSREPVGTGDHPTQPFLMKVTIQE